MILGDDGGLAQAFQQFCPQFVEPARHQEAQSSAQYFKRKADIRKMLDYPSLLRYFAYSVKKIVVIPT
jgi:hypothetical protein